MTRPAAVAAVALCVAASLSAATAVPQSVSYVVQIQIAAASDVSWEAEAASLTTDDDSDLVAVGAIDTLRIGELVIDLDSDLIWGGHDAPPEGSGIEILSAPQLRLPAGTPTVTQSSARVQYFELKDPDCYTLHTLPPESSPGIVLTLEANPGPDAEDPSDAETVTVDFTLRVSTIGRRQPVPGLDLDLGRPTITTQEVASRITTRLGPWNLLSRHASRDPDGSDDEVLLVLLRVIQPSS